MDVVAGGIRWLVRGGWPLVVGGVRGWGLRPCGVGWRAVVVVGVVLVVVVVGPLVVVAWVLVGLVLRVRPQDPLWVFPGALGLYYVVGRGGGSGAGLDGDGG